MKNIRFALCFLFLCVLFSGCNKNTSTGAANDSPLPTGIEVLTSAESGLEKPESFIKRAQIQDMNYGEDVEVKLKEMGFTEIHIFRNTDRDSIKMYYDENAVQGELKMNDSTVRWNFRIEKADSMTPGIALPEPLEVWDNGQAMIDGESQNYLIKATNNGFYELRMGYFPETQNLYTFWTNLNFLGEIRRTPLTLLQHWESDGIAPDYILSYDEYVACYNKPQIINFRIDVDGVRTEYQARLGMTLQEWVNSELNPGDWHYATYSNGYLLNSDNTYCLDPFADAFETVKAKRFKEDWDEPTDIPKYQERFAYYVNPESKLRIGGFKAFSPKSSEKFYENYYQMSYFSPYFSANDTISFGGYGTTQKYVENMEMYVLPHQGNYDTLPYNNDVEAIRNAGTKLTAEYVHNDTHVEGTPYIEFCYQNMFKAEYKPQNDPHFRYGSKVDVCFIYDNEVVYWMFLPAFR